MVVEPILGARQTVTWATMLMGHVHVNLPTRVAALVGYPVAACNATPILLLMQTTSCTWP